MTNPFVNAAGANEELARARANLQILGADYALLSSAENVTYVSHWEVPVDFGPSSAMRYGPPLALIGVRDSASGLILSDSYAADARAQSLLADVVTHPVFVLERSVSPRDGFLGSLRDVLAAAGLRNAHAKLAVEMDSLPAAALLLIQRDFPDIELVDAAPALEVARMVKTARELDLLRAVAEVNRAGHTELLRQAQGAGKTEFAMWSAVTQAMETAAGHSLFVFGELVTGPRCAVVRYPGGPHHVTTHPGDLALMDMSTRLNGYYSDCTNTMMIGGIEPNATQRRYGVAAREAFHAAADKLRPGHKAHEAFDAARATFKAHGLEIGHYAGHQIGLTVNEHPRLVPWEQTIVREGMVFSIETGAYEGEEGSTGARMEKSVIVHADGPEIICDFEWGF